LCAYDTDREGRGFSPAVSAPKKGALAPEAIPFGPQLKTKRAVSIVFCFQLFSYQLSSLNVLV